MGHIRLGRLPRTRNWDQVVSLISSGGGAAEVALAAMWASRNGLKIGAADPTLIYSTWLLTQIPLAAKGGNFSEELRKRGLDVSQQPTLLVIWIISKSPGSPSPRWRGSSRIGRPRG
jgi:hypothetical protein